MVREALQPTMTWAEDRATQRCDPSAVPGAKTEGRAVHRTNPWTALPSFLRDWHQSDKPSQQDAVIPSTRCRSTIANRKRARFQFTVNQHKKTSVLLDESKTAEELSTEAGSEMCRRPWGLLPSRHPSDDTGRWAPRSGIAFGRRHRLQLRESLFDGGLSNFSNLATR